MLVVHDLSFSDPGLYLQYLYLETSDALMGMWKSLEIKLADDKITVSQLKLLIVLLHHTRPLTNAEISRCGFRESQTVIGDIKNLEKHDYVIRVEDSNDKRKIGIAITDKGIELLKKHHEWVHSYRNEILSCFTKEELQQFVIYLKRLRNWVLDICGIDIVKPLNEFRPLYEFNDD